MTKQRRVAGLIWLLVIAVNIAVCIIALRMSLQERTPQQIAGLIWLACIVASAVIVTITFWVALRDFWAAREDARRDPDGIMRDVARALLRNAGFWFVVAVGFLGIALYARIDPRPDQLRLLALALVALVPGIAGLYQLRDRRVYEEKIKHRLIREQATGETD